MTDLPTPGQGTPRETLSAARDLAHRVRRLQRGAWFALLIVSAVTFLAIPVNRFGERGMTCRTIRTVPIESRVCSVYTTASFVYWPIALVLAYVAIAAFYVRRSRGRGIGTRIGPFAVAGIVLAVVLTALSVWLAHHPIAPNDILGLNLAPNSSLARFMVRLLTPSCAIGLALLVLSRIERDWALLTFTVGYLLVVLTGVSLGWTVAPRSQWFALPRLAIAGGLLLIAALAFAWRDLQGNGQGRLT